MPARIRRRATAGCCYPVGPVIVLQAGVLEAAWVVAQPRGGTGTSIY